MTPIPERMFFGNVGPDGVAKCTVLLNCAACSADELAQRLIMRHDLGALLRLELAPRSTKFLELRGTLDLPEETSSVEGSVVLEIGDEDGTRIELPVLAER